MADKNLTRIEEILNELFVGKDAALEKYAKVRHTYYELGVLWDKHNLPLWEVSPKAKMYFSKRFLNGKKIPDGIYDSKSGVATKEELQKGLSDLKHAVEDGCHGRCSRLVKELNRELGTFKIEPVDSEKFLDWLTFCYSVRKDYFSGDPVIEPGFHFEVRDFYDESNREDFWYETKALLKKGEIMSMHDILVVVLLKREKTVTLK